MQETTISRHSKAEKERENEPARARERERGKLPVYEQLRMSENFIGKSLTATTVVVQE